LLDANPLTNIRNTRRITAVIIGGQLIERPGLEAMLAKLRAPCEGNEAARGHEGRRADRHQACDAAHDGHK